MPAALANPALERAFSAFPAATAARAAAALRSILGDRLRKDGTGGWSSSRLTGDGFPVELAFTTGDDRLRYTAEPASRAVAPSERLDAAARVLSALGAAALSAQTLARLRRLQQRGSLAYGAWIGARHGSQADEYKLYVEVPESGAAPDSIEPFLTGPRLADRVLVPRMVAYSPASGAYEVYFRIEAAAPYHLPRLLAPAGVDSSAGAVEAFIEHAFGHRLRDKLPGASVGVSYALAAAGGVRSVTLFLYARSLWGHDARIRRRYTQAAQALGGDVERYARVTAPLAQRELRATRHGLVGLTLSSGTFSLNIGVRPE